MGSRLPSWPGGVATPMLFIGVDGVVGLTNLNSCVVVKEVGAFVRTNHPALRAPLLY